MLRHCDTRSTERYAKLADSALVEAFAAHEGAIGPFADVSVLKVCS
jgi:hypothetical protein